MVCVDYRTLNKNTVVDAYPLPRIDDSLEALGGSRYFSVFDLLSGFWQVPLSDDAKDKAAFCTRSGLYTWKCMPMGLANSPSTFERLMEIAMKGMQWKTMLVYLDDIICFSQTEHQHIERLAMIFERLRQANLKIKVSKSKLFQDQVKYLGHVISRNGIATDPEKITAIQKMKRPTNIKELRSLNGMISYYRRFYPDFADIIRPLHTLLKKHQKFKWNDECENAMQKLKEIMTSSTILAYPDFNKKFTLDTDCSGTAMGAVLSQTDENGIEKPIAYFSRTLNEAQKRYPITKQEMCALVEAIRHFKPYLYGAKFICRVDHHSLIWLTNMKNPTGILARWLETLAEYHFDVVHRPGKQHANADGLSRLSQSVHNSTETPISIPESTPYVRTIILNNEKLIREQKNDTELTPILQAIKDGYLPSYNEIKQYNRSTRYYLG